GGTYNLSSSGSSLLILSGAPTFTANEDATLSATLSGNGQLIKAGLGTLTITGGNTNTGAITVNAGRLLATGGSWYASRSIGSGSLFINPGATAEFTQAHGFGEDNYGRSAVVNGGILQFDLE